MLLNHWIKIFEKTTILLMNAAWINMADLKMYFQESITNKGKWTIQKLFIA